jgi:hypothetical protein
MFCSSSSQSHWFRGRTGPHIYGPRFDPSNPRHSKNWGGGATDEAVHTKTGPGPKQAMYCLLKNLWKTSQAQLMTQAYWIPIPPTTHVYSTLVCITQLRQNRFLYLIKNFVSGFFLQLETEVGFSVILCRCIQPEVLWPEPCHPPLFSRILLYISRHRPQLLLVKRKLPLTHWFLLEILAIGIERRAQVMPTCSIFEQEEPRTESQVNPRSRWAYCEVFLSKLDHRPQQGGSGKGGAGRGSRGGQYGHWGRWWMWPKR